MKFKNILIFSFLLFFTFLAFIPLQNSLKQLTVNESIIDVDTVKKGDEYRPMKIRLEYSNINSLTPKEYKFLQENLMGQVTTYLSNVYSMPAHKIDIDINHCREIRFEPLGVIDADIVIFVGSLHKPDELWKAAASPCHRDRLTKRIVGGEIMINSAKFSNIDEEEYLDFLGTLLHEFTHLLGFANYQFKNYEHKVSESWDGRNWIVAPEVVRIAREFYGCPQLKGLPLEDNGSSATAGSHWEKSTFVPEVMTGSSSVSFVYSIFTIKTLEASGWYKVNAEYAMEYLWGKGEGCKIPDGECVGQEYCSGRIRKTASSCSYNYDGKAQCFHRNVLCPKCSYWSGSFEEQCGMEEKCWEHEEKSLCLKSECHEDGIEWEHAGKRLRCGKEDKTVEGFRCPDRERFCSGSECSRNGKARKGECVCYPGFKGKRCEQINL